jgi:hypothetical protein
MSGGGSGSSGGSSGTIDYPAYMKTIHGLLLDGGGADTPSSSVVDCINTALATSPYTGLTAYDPDTDITAQETAISAFSALAVALSYHTDFDAMAAAAVAEIDAVVLPSSYVTAKAAAYATDLDTAINTATYARFQAGMRDIGAVMTSAFTIGAANIEAEKTRQVAKFTADLNFQVDRERAAMIGSSVQIMSTMLTSKLEFNRVLVALTMEQKRMKIVAKDEEEKRNAEIDVLDAKWDLELFAYASNVLAGIAGGTTGSKTDTRSPLSNALGGALSGAAVGMQIGGPVGAGIGGVLGLAAGFL